MHSCAACADHEIRGPYTSGSNCLTALALSLRDQVRDAHLQSLLGGARFACETIRALKLAPPATPACGTAAAEARGAAPVRRPAPQPGGALKGPSGGPLEGPSGGPSAEGPSAEGPFGSPVLGACAPPPCDWEALLLEDAPEDYGQMATYDGSGGGVFLLDDSEGGKFVAGLPARVSGNMAALVRLSEPDPHAALAKPRDSSARQLSINMHKTQSFDRPPLGAAGAQPLRGRLYGHAARAAPRPLRRRRAPPFESASGLARQGGPHPPGLRRPRSELRCFGRFIGGPGIGVPLARFGGGGGAPSRRRRDDRAPVGVAAGDAHVLKAHWAHSYQSLRVSTTCSIRYTNR